MSAADDSPLKSASEMSARLLIAALLATAAAAAHGAGHTCIQDRIQARRRAANASEPRHAQDYGGVGGRMLESSSFSPIRIVPVYLGEAKAGGGTVVTDTVRDYLKNSIVKAAIDNWQAMLSVVPVAGKLFASRTCNGFFGASDGTPDGDVLAYKCGGYATNDYFCGDQTQGGRIASVDADLNILVDTYADAAPYYTGSCSVSGGTATCATATVPAGSGVPNADFVLFVTAKQTADCPAQGASGTLAYASTCQRDQSDRPTWGRVNFCPYAISTEAADLPLQIAVATHELNHALGFNSGSWALWRNADGSPRTPRDAYGDPATAFKYKCGGTQRERDIVSSSTVAFSAERGMTQCSQLANSNPTADFTLSNCVHRIVTPTVVAAARAHFGCPSLAGAELENHLTTPCGSMGSHWEQRVLNTELMSSYVQHTSIVSAMTLALHEDSGWYRANYNAVTGVTVRNTWRKGDWGFLQGCDFAQKECLKKSTSTNTDKTPVPVLADPQHFFGVSASQSSHSAACSTDRRFWGNAAVSSYASDVPAQYRYFLQNSGEQDLRRSGSLDAPDFCPMAAPFSDAGMCSDSTQQPSNGVNAFGETYGVGSACFKSSLVETGYNQPGNGAACMPFSCSADKASVTITVKFYQATTVTPATVLCGPNDIGKPKPATGFAGMPDGVSAGTITCPDPAELCATPVHVTPCPAGATLQLDGTCSSSSAATATATASATATVTQTPVPQLPVASARPTSAVGTLTVYAALVFTKSGGGGGGGGSSVDVTAFASVNAVDALAASIKAALADSLDAAASAAGAASPTAATKQAIGVTITSITDVATGNFIYQVANPGARRLSGAPGSQGVKIDFVTQVPPTVAGGATLASMLAAAVGPSGSGAAGFLSAVVTRAAAGGFVGLTATAAAPSVALPAPKVDGDPLGVAIGSAVGALVVAVFVGIAARVVLRRMLSREGKVAPAEAAAAPVRRATGSSV